MPEIPDIFSGSLLHQTVVFVGGAEQNLGPSLCIKSTPSGIRTHHNVIALVLDLMTECIANPQVIHHRCWRPKKARDEQFATEHYEFCLIGVGSVLFESGLDSCFLCFIELYCRAPNMNQ